MHLLNRKAFQSRSNDLDDAIDNESIYIDSYHPPIRNDRNIYGGGLAIYILDKLTFYESTDLSMQGLEITLSEHTCKQQNIFDRYIV